MLSILSLLFCSAAQITVHPFYSFAHLFKLKKYEEREGERDKEKQFASVYTCSRNIVCAHFVCS